RWIKAGDRSHSALSGHQSGPEGLRVLTDRSEKAKTGDHNPPPHRHPALFQNMVPPLLWGLRDGFIPCNPNENTPVGGCRPNLRHSIFKILNWIVPSGAGTLTVSPSCLPISAEPIGDSLEIFWEIGSDSALPTIVYVSTSPSGNS